MTNGKKTSVGLLILTTLPDMSEPVAVLQVRGELNTEKLGPESWPGLCQVTCHGKMESEDEGDIMKCLFREIYEELGIEPEYMAKHWDAGVSDVLNNELFRKETKDKLVVTYGLVLPPEFLKQVRLSGSSGGLRLITKHQADGIRDTEHIDKALGVPQRGITAMFDDERKAVQKAFDHFFPGRTW